MAHFVLRGPMCSSGNALPIDAGTLNRSASFAPGAVCAVGVAAPLVRVAPREPSLCLAMRCSAAGRKFIFSIEVGGLKKVTARLHWPGGNSGVTLGPGYDMKDRSAASVQADLVQIGVDAASANTAAQGAGLKGEEAEDFADDHADLLTLTDAQQVALLARVVPHYEAIVNRHIEIALRQHEFDALVSFVYNPGGSFKPVAHLVNRDEMKAAAEIVRQRTKSKRKVMKGLIVRRMRECNLLLNAAY